MIETIQDLIRQIGPVGYPLAALSFTGSVLIAERLLFFIMLPRVETAESFQTLAQELQNNKTLAKTIRDELISFRLTMLQAQWTRGIHFLRIIAVLSPMLGLLGTVLGMIKAFRDIAGQTGPVSPNMIADGIQSAMITTAYGLSIALPCLLAAFIYARIAEKRLGIFQQRLNIQSLELEGVMLG